MSAPTSASKPCKIMPDFTFIAVSLIQTDHGNVDGRGPVEITLQTRLRKFSSIIDSDGAGLWSHGEWWSFGVAPTAAAIPDLMEMVSTKAGKTIWNTQDIRGETGNLDEYGTRVAGLLAIPISVSSPDFLVFFRTEETHQCEWAGEPRKLEQLTENGVRLSPRGSFDTWREDVRHKSLPWTDADLVVANAIRSYVRDVMLSHNDATEEQRERNEQQRTLVNSEMTHRVKNILALVKSIAIQTGANSDSVDDYTVSFEGRLRALSYAHDQSFAGTEGGELGSFIEAEAGMHRFAGMPDRIQVSGEPVGLTERCFGVFALLLHEMMTNAAKYGGLSVPSGTLEISWKLTDEGYCLVKWIESGGPEVVAPTRRGFGSNLIERTVAYDLGGTVDIDFDPAGLRAAILLPARHLRSVNARASTADAPSGPTMRHLEGLRVLLVEDQSLIAMETEEMLGSLGATEFAVAASVDMGQGYIDMLDGVYRTGEPFIARDLSIELNRGKEGEKQSRVIDLVYQPMRNDDGTVGGILVQARDDFRAEKDRQALLSHELSHRLKNQLGMVQSIESQTPKNAPDLATARLRLSERIAVLSAAHDAILEGGRGSSTLRHLVGQMTSLHDDLENPRIRASGPNLKIGSRPSLSLSLILHELATNAMKYGSLPVPDGIVELKWRVAGEAGDRFEMFWSEKDGSKVDATPQRGTGTRLISAGLNGTADCSVNIECAEDGVRCSVSCELESFQKEH